MKTKNLIKYKEDYFSFCAQQKKLDRKTLKAYKIDINQFISYFQNISIEKESLETYIKYLHKQYKPKTVKRKIASLKAYFAYLEYEELISENIFTKMKLKFREPIILPKTIPLNKIESILQNAYLASTNSTTQNEKKAITRDISVLEVLFSTGIRVSELCEIAVTNVDLDTGTIKVLGKGSKERIIRICNDSVLNTLRLYKQYFKHEMDKTGYFFINRLGSKLSDQSVRIIINKYSPDLHITPHMFRHSFATLLLEQDVDIRYIQNMLGHSSITTTQIYTYVASAKQNEILATKHPRNQMQL